MPGRKTGPPARYSVASYDPGPQRGRYGPPDTSPDPGARVNRSSSDVRSRRAITNLYVQHDAPASTEGPFLWLQTGLGDDGAGITLWVEDGA